MKTLCLFSGIGGMSVGTPVMYCEIDVHTRAVLLARIADGSLSYAPVWPDIRTLHSLPSPVDIIHGGFPCQNISQGGLKAGFDGDKSVLFFEVARLVELHMPLLVFLENVSELVRLPNVWKPVLSVMHWLGYDCQWIVTGADQSGAPHRRHRWFMLAKRVRAKSDTEIVPLLHLPGKKMHLCGSLVEGVYSTTAAVAAPARLLNPPVILAPVKGAVCKSIDIVPQPLQRERWATIRRSGGNCPAGNLTRRCAHDLGTQLRFATCTPTKDRLIGTPCSVNAEWAEWLMGFPPGWTVPSGQVNRQHPGWREEPPVKRLVPNSRQNSRRLQLLGNACVPQQCTFAYHELQNRFLASPVTIPKKVSHD